MSKLAEIFRHKRQEVVAARSHTPLANLMSVAKDADAPRGFLAALKGASVPVSLIAEVKKASPSQGLIRSDFDPAEIGRVYAEAGAHCLSVLTDERYFQGSAENLKGARESSGLPCLRKDFIDDPYQIWEARAWGADAVLLIVAALELSQLSDLHALSHDLGMDVLVEVHSRAETEVALSIGAPLIGVNNRDLSTFSTHLETSELLLPLIKPHAFAISESAIESHADVARVATAGAQAVLIGTRFTSSPDIGGAVKAVMGW